jgi:hypothetical protein
VARRREAWRDYRDAAVAAVIAFDRASRHAANAAPEIDPFLVGWA